MVRSLLIAGSAVAALALVGCAHTVDGSPASPPSFESAPPPEEREVIAIDTAPRLEPEAAKARPRLSQTVTLGQGQSESLYAPQPAAPSREGGGPNVTVNNNITINQTPSYGGYGYGYGYGYGGYGAGRGARGDGVGTQQGQGTRSAWAPNGWEGARRTAAPGATPGIGGNFAPAPSFGPAPMR